MYASSIDLSANAQAASIALLRARLADAIDLAAKLKHAHWNIRGPHFIALHLLFDELHDEVDAHADLLAERIAAFGADVDGLVQQVAKVTTLPAYPSDTHSERSHLDALASASAAFGSKIRTAAQETTEAGDLGTADIFTEISRAADKQLWKIEAHFKPAR
jgi:starvation-inducible DNA-binding protein